MHLAPLPSCALASRTGRSQLVCAVRRMHAATLVATLRVRQSGARSLLFIAVSAALAMSIARLGLYAMRFRRQTAGICGCRCISFAQVLSAPSLTEVSFDASRSRYFRWRLSPPHLWLVALAAPAVLCPGRPCAGRASALWVRYSHGGCFSAGLWCYERRCEILYKLESDTRDSGSLLAP